MAEFAKVGLALAALRKAAGLRQLDVAERLGVRASTVGRFEGLDGNPRAKSIDRYLEAIGATPMDLARALQGEVGGGSEAAGGSGGAEELAKLREDIAAMNRGVASLRDEFYRYRDDMTLRIAREAAEKMRAASEASEASPKKKGSRSSGG